MPRPKALTIAGSDSGGGAGIQADLKTFTVLGVYGLSVITALTAQNTTGVQGIHEVPPQFVGQQLDSVLRDIGCDAAKTGMLASASIVEVVADRIAHYGVENLVVDPVMVAKSGDHLLREDAVSALKSTLLPLACVVTPNTEEAAILAEMPSIERVEDIKEAAKRIHDLGPRTVLIKGGHLSGAECEDFWFDGEEFAVFTGERLNARHTHGTGCTLSAALAARLAAGVEPLDAAREAKRFITRAIGSAEPLGSGIGPVNHFWPLEDR